MSVPLEDPPSIESSAREPQTNTLQERITIVVRLLLARYGMRQMDLAHALAVDNSTITRIFQGQRAWKVTDIEVMAALFGVPPNVFFEHPDSLFLATGT